MPLPRLSSAVPAINSTLTAIIRTLNREYPYPYRDYPYPYRDYPYRAQGSGLTQAVDGELPLAHARDLVAVLRDPPKYLRFDSW